MTAVIRGEHSLIEILSLEGCNVVYTGHQMTAILTTDSPALVVYSNLVFFFLSKGGRYTGADQLYIFLLWIQHVVVGHFPRETHTL